jgi:ATP-dependent Lhr-like helicase
MFRFLEVANAWSTAGADPIQSAPLPASPAAALDMLHPIVAQWFRSRFAEPTRAQCHAWPLIAAGRNLLLAAPTGTGKTWAAFLPIVSRLLWESDGQGCSQTGIRCVYLSPLRALCQDVEVHLERLVQQLPDAGFLRVARRTGDADAWTRQRLWRSPPHILLTTPESLALLLTHPWAARTFRGLSWIVVDEVHALAGCKRGCDLALTLERVAVLAAADPQRIGLSATCQPLSEVGRWLAGSHRSITLAAVPDLHPLQLQVEYLCPSAGLAQDPGQPQEVAPTAMPHAGTTSGFLHALQERLKLLVSQAATTLVFVNTRSLAERLVWTLRRAWPEQAQRIAVHHSSLSRQHRQEVESQLRSGRLRLVVTSSSLELGVDIGAVEQVVLVDPPGGIARLLQRVGRSGHAPGQPRRGICFVSQPAALLEAVVSSDAAEDRCLEPLSVPRFPLDVLCQQLLGLAAQGPCPAARAWHLVRAAYPFCDLPLEAFASCLGYLSGMSPGTHPSPRIVWDDGRFRLANRRTLRLYRTNVGVLQEETGRLVRTATGGELGTLHEDFAAQLQPGDRFLLGGCCLEVAGGSSQEILVWPGWGAPLAPRWQGGTWRTPQELAERMWLYLQHWVEARPRPRHAAEEALFAWFEAQERCSSIPGDSTVSAEVFPAADGDGLLYAVHLPLCPQASEAVARVAAYRLGCKVAACGCLGFTLASSRRRPLEARDLREALLPERFREDLERSLLGSPVLAEEFRRTATNALMLLKQPLGRRRVVGGRHWAGRRLMHWLRLADPASPLLRQALRDAAVGLLAADAAERTLARFAGLPVVLRPLPCSSPFADAWNRRSVAWAPLGPGAGSLQAGASGQPAVRIGEELLLTVQRAAVHLPSRTAVIADVHLGYEGVRQAHGEAVPTLGWQALRQRLEQLQVQYGVRQIVVAGDLLEDARHPQPLAELLAWLDQRGLALWLVPGNHDRGLGSQEALRWFPAGVRLGRWLVLHQRDAARPQPQIIGHHHPSVRLGGPGRTAPCFLVRDDLLVLPAASDDAAGMGLRHPRQLQGWRCYAILGNEMVRVEPAPVGHSEPAPMRLTSSSPGRPKERTAPKALFGK